MRPPPRPGLPSNISRTCSPIPRAGFGAQVGPETPYKATQLAVLAVLTDVSAGTPEPANVAQWPLATPFASFGIAFFGYRCGVVSGSDAATLLPVVKGASETTVFRDARGVFGDVIVRVFMPGEPDPCQAG